MKNQKLNFKGIDKSRCVYLGETRGWKGDDGGGRSGDGGSTGTGGWPSTNGLPVAAHDRRSELTSLLQP